MKKPKKSLGYDNDYYSFAISLLIHCKFRPINDDDITDVMNHLILAESKFNGNGSVRAFMAMCGKRLIHKMIKRANLLKKHEISLSNCEHAVDDATYKTFTSESPNNEMLSYITSPDDVGQENAEVVSMFLDGMTTTEIGKIKNVSKQRISQRLNTAIAKTRRHFN